MIEREEIVAALIAAAPGKQLVGRVRLQKTAYLLERLGLEKALRFEYYHYGPYCRELDNAINDAEALGLIEEKFEHRKSDGARFSVFRLKRDQAVHDGIYGSLGRSNTVDLISNFAQTNVTVLELAATVDWLWRYEKVEDWRTEITRRKGKKVLGGRLDKAVDLLGSIDLAPPAPKPEPTLF